MTNMDGSIPLVILAGGDGRRIGGDKAARRLAGESLLDHAMAKAARYSSVVAVSVRAGEYPLPRNIGLLQDREDISGPLAGLAAALKWAKDMDAAHVAIIPCDSPFLPDDLLIRLSAGIADRVAAIPQYGGRLHVACSLWRATAAEFLSGYIGDGRRSLIGFAEHAGYVAVEWPEQDIDPFFNINTTDDLAEAERIFGLTR